MTRQTKHQVPRGAMADAERFNRLYLIKKVSTLRATYQIRLLTYRAMTEGLLLVLNVPSACKFDQSLVLLMQKAGKAVIRENF